jgi:hypothetical protein
VLGETVKRLIMKLAPMTLGLLATVSLASPAFARGGPLHLLDPALNPQHISGLPAEVRNAVAQMCRDPQAEHQFASYSQQRVLVLHFEHLRCGNGAKFCTQAGCLHQVYTSTDGHYRLSRTYRALDN